jgi:Flp pilus assembly protein CpaB
VSSRRTLILLGAIAVGVIAALLLFNYVRGIEDRANENAKRVDVFAAQADIIRGTPGETAVADGSIATSKIPQEFKPTTAITTTDEIQKKVALFDIPQNTVIVKDMFVDPASTQISFRARLKDPNHQAITVNVDQVRAVGGFLVPGDQVNIMVLQEIQVDNEEQVCRGQTLDSMPLACVFKSWPRYLYQQVHILAIGSQPELSPGEQVSTTSADGTTTTQQTGSSGTITFNVPPQAAQWIAAAQASGGMYLTLVAEDYAPQELAPLDPNLTRLPGEDPAQLTPYGPAGDPE